MKRHGFWHIVWLRGQVVFKTAEFPRWHVRLFPLMVQWWSQESGWRRLEVRWRW